MSPPYSSLYASGGDALSSCGGPCSWCGDRLLRLSSLLLLPLPDRSRCPITWAPAVSRLALEWCRLPLLLAPPPPDASEASRAEYRSNSGSGKLAQSAVISVPSRSALRITLRNVFCTRFSCSRDLHWPNAVLTQSTSAGGHSAPVWRRGSGGGFVCRRMQYRAGRRRVDVEDVENVKREMARVGLSGESAGHSFCGAVTSSVKIDTSTLRSVHRQNAACVDCECVPQSDDSGHTRSSAPFVVSVPLVPLLTLPVLVERFEPRPPRAVPALM